MGSFDAAHSDRIEAPSDGAAPSARRHHEGQVAANDIDPDRRDGCKTGSVQAVRSLATRPEVSVGSTDDAISDLDP